MGAVLVLGSAIAAVIQVAVPREVILNLGAGPVTSIFAMMLLAGFDLFDRGLILCSVFCLHIYQWLLACVSSLWTDD